MAIPNRRKVSLEQFPSHESVILSCLPHSWHAATPDLYTADSRFLEPTRQNIYFEGTMPNRSNADKQNIHLPAMWTTLPRSNVLALGCKGI